jgi:hypothetical protein
MEYTDVFNAVECALCGAVRVSFCCAMCKGYERFVGLVLFYMECFLLWGEKIL